MHTTPYRAPAKPVWPFLVPLSGRQPNHGVERDPAMEESAADSAFEHDETGAVTAATAKVVAFRFRAD